MKSLSLSLFSLLFSFLSFSQEKIQLVTGFSGSFSKEIRSNTSSQIFGGLDLDLGVKLSNKKSGELFFCLTYGFSSNFMSYNTYGGVYDEDLYTYKINSLQRNHFLGVSLKYLFLNIEAKYRPFIDIKILSEISSNYKNGRLMENNLIPMNHPYGTGQFPTPFYSTLYHSTPFVGSAVLGCDFRLIESLHLNLGIGYGFRIMKTKYASWYENEDLNVVAQDKPTKNIRSHMIDLQLGLTYAFSLKNKEQK